MILKKCLVFTLSLLISSSIFADSRSDIENRIKPLGQVQIKGDDNSKISFDLFTFCIKFCTFFDLFLFLRPNVASSMVFSCFAAFAFLLNGCLG